MDQEIPRCCASISPSAVAAANPEAILHGASLDSQELREAKWFLKQSKHLLWKLKEKDQSGFVESNCSDWVVAILDTGVACEDYSDSTGDYLSAESFAQTAFVELYDDHHHSTHIAHIRPLLSAKAHSA